MTDQVVMGPDGQKIYTREWSIDRPNGALVLLHGLGEHVCRYEYVAQVLNQAGYAVSGFDLPGHGKTGGIQGHIASYQEAMDLVSWRLAAAAERYPGLPLFLYGHSMGGNLALYYAITQKPDLNGLIITAPGLGTTTPVPGWKVALGKMLYQLAPTFQMQNGLDENGLSHDRNVVQAYQGDPLVHHKVSTRLGLDMINNGTWIIAHASEFPPIPILVMQGSADPIVSPEMTRAFVNGCGPTCTFRVWDGLYHELHNEYEKDEVLKEITNWLDQHLVKQPS